MQRKCWLTCLVSLAACSGDLEPRLPDPPQAGEDQAEEGLVPEGLARSVTQGDEVGNCPTGPVPAGCWKVGGGCYWTNVALDCPSALLAYAVTTSPILGQIDPIDVGARAATYCAMYCTPGGTEQLSPGQAVQSAAQCIDGAAFGPAVISVLDCSLCGSIAVHTVAAPETCGLDDECGQLVCGDHGCDLDCGETTTSCPADCSDVLGPP